MTGDGEGGRAGEGADEGAGAGGGERHSGGASGRGTTPPGRRPSLTTVLLGVSVVVGTLLLLLGADRLARWGAESILARNIQEATGVSQLPSVQVHGTFVLLQAVQGRYDDVEVGLDEVSSGPMTVEAVRARLTGVHVSFHDLLVRSRNPVWIEQSVGQAHLSYDDLNDYLEVTGRSVAVGSAQGGEVSLSGTVDLLGQPISASAVARLSPRGSALAIAPTAVDTDTVLDQASRLLLGQRFAFLVPLDPLPFGQELTAVEPGADGMVVQAQGRDVVIRP